MKKLITLLLSLTMVIGLSACVKDQEFEITFNSNGGSSVATVILSDTDTFTLPEDPVKDGYEFAGWFMDSALENEFSINDVTENITVYAKWTSVEVSLTSNLVHIYTLATEAGEFDGTYEEWLETIKGEQGLPGIDGREAEFQVSDGYLQWKYTDDDKWTNLISLDALAGKDGLDGAAGTPGEDGLSAFEIYKSYHKDYTGTEEEWIEAIVNGTLSEAQQFTVTFDTAGGSPVDSQSVALGYKVVEPSNPTREGYTFDGWTINGDDEWVFYGYSVSEDMTLTANWILNTRTIVFYDFDGNRIGNIIGLDYGTSTSSITIPDAPISEDLLFLGWDTELPETMPDYDIQIHPLSMPAMVYTRSVSDSGFGESISMNSNSFLAGMPYSNFALQFGLTDTDSVYTFENVYLTGDERYGSKVLLTEEYAIISAPSYNNGQGAIYVRPLVVPSAEYTYTGTGTDDWDGFGTSFDLIDERFLIVAAPGYQDGVGAVFVYDLQDSAYERIIVGEDGVGTYFGSRIVGQQGYDYEYLNMSTMQMQTVHIAGGMFAVQTPYYNGYEGKITIYDVFDDTYSRVLQVDELVDTSAYFGRQMAFQDHFFITNANIGGAQDVIYIFQVTDEDYFRRITNDAYPSFAKVFYVDDEGLFIGSSNAVHQYKLYDSAFELHFDTQSSGYVSDLVHANGYIVASVFTEGQNLDLEIFKLSDPSFYLQVPQPSNAGIFFGRSLETNGSVVLVRAPNYNDTYGAVYLLDTADFE